MRDETERLTAAQKGIVAPLESEIDRLRAQIAVKDECLRHFAKKYEGRPLTTEEHGAQNWIHQALTADGAMKRQEAKS